MSPIENITSPEDKKTEVPKPSLLNIFKNLFKKEEVVTVEKLDTLKENVLVEKNNEESSYIPSQKDDENMAAALNEQNLENFIPPKEMADEDVVPYTQEELVKYGLAQK